MNLKQKTVFIGIDIGSADIKAVEIESGAAGGVILKKANIVPKADGLKKVLSGMHLKGAKAVGIVDSPATCLRYFTVPKMPGKELSEAVKWEAKDKVSSPLEELLMDYEVQEEIEEAGIKKLKIKFAAAPKKFINEITALLTEAGLEPVSAIQPPLAIEHLAKRMGVSGSDTVAVIDMGAESTGINIIKGGSLKFHRKIGSGGVAITKAIASVLITEQGRVELGFDDAEGLKLKYGIPGLPGTELLDGKINSQQFISLIRPATERLVQEIERSFEYYSDGSLGDKVKSVILLGGGASLKGLAQFLQEGLAIPVSVGNPMNGLNVAKGALGPDIEPHIFACAIGAALSEGRGINLLPPELKRKTIRTFEKAAVESMVAAVIIIFVLTFTGMRLQLSSYEKKIIYGDKELEAMRPQIQIAQNYDRMNIEITRKKSFMEKMLAEEPPLKEVLRELSNKLPREAVLTSLRINDKELVVKGEIVGEVVNREQILSGIISALEGGLFYDTSLVNAVMSEESKSKAEFKIKCEF